MSQDLILRPDTAGKVRWSIVDRPSGQRVQEGEADADSALDITGFDAVDRTLVLLPSEAVFFTHVDLPARTEREAAQAAPFAIEEELASRLSETCVVTGTRQDDGSRWVMAADKTLVADWRARIADVAVRPVFVLPDCLAAAEPDTALTLFDRGDCVLWYYGNAARKTGCPAGGALEPGLFGPLVTALVEGAQGGETAVSSSLGLAGERLRQVPRADLDLRASALPADLLAGLPPLLGSDLLSRLNWNGLVAPLKRPLALAAALLAGFCLLMGGEGVYFSLQADRFDAAAVAEFRAARPDITRRVIPAEAERLLNESLARLGGGEATSSFLQLMAALAELTEGSETVRIDHVRFDRARGELSVSALYTDFADFDALSERAGQLGIVLTDGGARESGSALQGEFTVRLP